ncbi:YegJ family protein [Tropicibacter alexandrii]|uniref:YegJ family protein n=1 Tax=Tropicibacter alexandrii TaxID=2267683 RepID=UPI000EF44BC8|nr:DUF2314 domain-containing protein [Tropicibacter alexandrii]
MTRRGLILSLMLLAGTPAAAQDEVIDYVADDPRMNAAMAAALKHLDPVLALVVNEDGTPHPALNLKVAIPIRMGPVTDEIIWIETIGRDDATFIGTLANEPMHFEGAIGDPVRFEKGQIRDWSILTSTGQMFGHYTTRVMLDDLSDAEADGIRAILTPDPLPAGLQ